MKVVVAFIVCFTFFMAGMELKNYLVWEKINSCRNDIDHRAFNKEKDEFYHHHKLKDYKSFDGLLNHIEGYMDVKWRKCFMKRMFYEI